MFEDEQGWLASVRPRCECMQNKNVRSAGASSSLKADEILAARENLQDALVLQKKGPPGRRVPESLCVEIDKLLHTLELSIRYRERGSFDTSLVEK